MKRREIEFGCGCAPIALAVFVWLCLAVLWMLGRSMIE